MTHYYIDGYNLLFRLLSANDKGLRAQREQLITSLNAKAAFLELNITLIFDAQYQLDDTQRTHYDQLEIFYTSYGETADEAILNEVKAEPSPQHVTVVTSDKKLAWFARRCSAKTETVEDFNRWLHKRYLNKQRLLKNPPPARKEVNAVLVLKPLPVVDAPKPSMLPTAESSVTECFDYYLNFFEKEYDVLVIQEASMKETRKRSRKKEPRHVNPLSPEVKSKKVKKADGQENQVTDVQRWMKAFERDLTDENE